MHFFDSIIFLQLFLIFQYSHCFPNNNPNEFIGQWEPLKIAPINFPPCNGAKLPSKIKNFLHSALENVGQIISVRPAKIMENGKLIKTIQKCLEIVDGPMEMAKWAKAIENANAEFANQYFGIFPNFYLIIQLNLPSICHSPNSPSDVLAAAAPCLFPPFSQRPIAAKLVICAENKRWKYYGAGMDIFRHEILHSLGFGMILPPQNNQIPFPKIWQNWKLPSGNFLHRSVHFMDFSTKAMEFGREYFGCPKMEGIEAENNQKMHLSEYFFGNELMTPLLNGGPNYLTMFSALILEETFIGPDQWYQTNRQIVERETRAFWWGRRFGCEFLWKSCFELAEMGGKWPFCGERELGEQSRSEFGAKEMCFWNGTNWGRRKYKCQLLEGLEIQQNDGMKPISLSSQFPSIFGNRRIFGSEFDNFYCPIIENQFDHPLEMESAILVECK